MSAVLTFQGSSCGFANHKGREPHWINKFEKWASSTWQEPGIVHCQSTSKNCKSVPRQSVHYTRWIWPKFWKNWPLIILIEIARGRFPQVIGIMDYFNVRVFLRDPDCVSWRRFWPRRLGINILNRCWPANTTAVPQILRYETELLSWLPVSVDATFQISE